MTTFRPGTVVSYTPDPKRHDPMWCREGTAVADNAGRLIDTYWGSGSDSHVVTPAEMDSVEVLFHLDDFDELDRWRPDKNLWESFAPTDRREITSQHGLQRRLFVGKGAKPDLATQVANAETKVYDAESALDSANWHLAWARKELEALTSPKEN